MAISVLEQRTAAPAFRGYLVRELAGRRSFEEVAYLVWHGELPAHHQIVAQNRAERAQRALPPRIAAALAELPATGHPMDTLRTAVNLLGASDPSGDDSPAGAAAKALRLFAALPSVVAMDQRRRHGLGPVQPRDHLGYAANFLYMTFGKVPEPQIVAAFETSLILHAEDCLHATACPAATDPYDAVAAGLDALSGSLGAGRGAAVTQMLDDIAIPDNARPWLEDALAAGREIPGFGHPGEPGDTRVPIMRAALGMVAALRRGEHLIDVYEALQAAAYDANRLLPSLDYPSCPAYRLMGFDTPTFAPIFATARVPGWTAVLAG